MQLVVLVHIFAPFGLTDVHITFEKVDMVSPQLSI